MDTDEKPLALICSVNQIVLHIFSEFQIRNTMTTVRARTTKIWTAVAERSGDTAFRTVGCAQKRRGASLPAAIQNPWLRHKPFWVHLCPSVVKRFF
jgi:hypothetical protein